MIIIRIRSIRSSVAVPKPFWRGSPIVHHTVSDGAEPVDRLIGQSLAIKRDSGFSPICGKTRKLLREGCRTAANGEPPEGAGSSARFRPIVPRSGKKLVRTNSSFDRYFPRVDYRKTAVSNSGFDERITGGSDDASASIAGIEPRPGYLRRPRWRHVVVSVRYGRRRWSRRIGDWQHGHQWGGTDAARHRNALRNTRKLRSSRRTNVQRGRQPRWEHAIVQTGYGRQSIALLSVGAY